MIFLNNFSNIYYHFFKFFQNVYTEKETHNISLTFYYFFMKLKFDFYVYDFESVQGCLNQAGFYNNY